MKHIALTLALALAPIAGLAQTEPPPGPENAGPNPQLMQAMRATRAQAHALELQSRTQMLGSLSAAHRAQIAALVGQFAVSPNPDRATLEKQIDAVLSRNEAQAIVNAASAERTNAHALMASARAQFEASLTPDELAKMKEHEAKMDAERAEHETRPVDPARELLRSMISGGHEMHGPDDHHQ